METLNMMSRGDISQFPYGDIKTVFKNHSRDARKKGRSIQGLVNSSPSTSSLKHEIRSMFEDFKSEILHKFALHMDTMKIKRRQEDGERELAIFFPRFIKRRPKNEWPLNVIEIYSICE